MWAVAMARRGTAAMGFRAQGKAEAAGLREVAASRPPPRAGPSLPPGARRTPSPRGTRAQRGPQRSRMAAEPPALPNPGGPGVCESA